MIVKATASENADRDAQAVAWLLSQGKTQKEIAELMGVSQPVVSRLKERAETEKWLKTEVTCDLTLEQKAEAQKRVWPDFKRLLDVLADAAARAAGNPFVPAGVRVYDTGGRAIDPDGYNQQLRQFGRLAANRLGDLLRPEDVKVVGVTWGKTIACLIEAIEIRYPTPLRKLNPIDFVPLSGVLLSDPSIELSSTTLVAKLHKIVNGQESGARSLAAVPARIPAKFQRTGAELTASERKTLKKFIDDIPGYQAIFEGASGKPRVDEIDFILTSVGCDYSQSNDPWLDEMISHETLTKGELARVAIGDLGGIFLPTPTANPTPTAKKSDLEKQDEINEKKLDEINRRWKGATIKHVKNCAAQAAERNAPGVIVIAMGARKARIVLECVRKGLVNQLIIDRDLAEAIVAVKAD